MSRNSIRYILVNPTLLLSIARNSIINILSINFSPEIRSDRLYSVNLIVDSVEIADKYNSRSNTFSNGLRLILIIFKLRVSRLKLVIVIRKVDLLTT